LCQNEENESRPNGTTQKEVQVEEPWILKGGGQEDKKTIDDSRQNNNNR
jgi:hypothetical protein